jgi:hypothetical protein
MKTVCIDIYILYRKLLESSPTAPEAAMPGSSRSPESGPEPGAGSPPGMPRWIKWSAIIVGVLILLFAVLQLAGIGPEHGPGLHG